MDATNIEGIKAGLKEIGGGCKVEYITKAVFSTGILFDYKRTKTLETAEKWAKRYEADGLNVEIQCVLTCGIMVYRTGTGTDAGAELREERRR